MEISFIDVCRAAEPVDHARAALALWQRLAPFGARDDVTIGDVAAHLDDDLPGAGVRLLSQAREIVEGARGLGVRAQYPVLFDPASDVLDPSIGVQGGSLLLFREHCRLIGASGWCRVTATDAPELPCGLAERRAVRVASYLADRLPRGMRLEVGRLHPDDVMPPTRTASGRVWGVDVEVGIRTACMSLLDLRCRVRQWEELLAMPPAG